MHDQVRHGRGALERLAWQRLGFVGAGSDEQIQTIVEPHLRDILIRGKSAGCA